MKYSEIKVGDKFIRIDKNNRKWIATIINRTEYFVDVEKCCPYKQKVGDGYGWKWADTPNEQERCKITPEMQRVKSGTCKSFTGKIIDTFKWVETGNYAISCKVFINNQVGYIDYVYQWEHNK